MKKMITVILLCVLFVHGNCISYYENIEKNKNTMEKDYNEFFSDFFSKKFDYELIRKYIESSENYTDSVLNKPFFYLKNRFENQFYSNRIIFLDENRVLMSNSNYFSVYRFDEKGIKERIFESRKINRIMYINTGDFDYDNQKDIFIIAKEGILYYTIASNKISFVQKENNSYDISSLNRVDMKSGDSILIGKVYEQTDFLYNFFNEKLYYFRWIFPGMDKKQMLVDSEFKGSVVRITDFNGDGHPDIIGSREEKDKLVISIYFNDRFNNFKDKKSFIINRSGFIDFQIKGTDFYALFIDGVQVGSINDKDLIINPNFFNIKGCVSFDIDEKDNVYVYTLDNYINIFARLI